MDPMPAGRESGYKSDTLAVTLAAFELRSISAYLLMQRLGVVHEGGNFSAR